MSIAVIGAGYAGMAAAAELAAAGHRITVFEASRTLGGRARAIDLDGMTVDNGAHLLVGAYRETLRLMRLVGANPDRLFHRRRLRLEYPGELRIAAPCLPAPLHLAAALLGARGLSWSEKFAAIRFMQSLKRRRFRLAQDTTVVAWLHQAAQPERLVRYLWGPLCVAALNTPIERASMQVFANVLRDSLAAERAACDFLFPTVDFSRLFPEPAAAFVAARGGQLRRETRIKEIIRDPTGYRLDGHGPFAGVVIAVAPRHLARLVAPLPELAPVAAMTGGYVFEPIVGAFLAYPDTVRLPHELIGVAGGTAQWLFDRGRTNGQPGLISAVISSHGHHDALDHAALIAAIHADIARVVPHLSAPQWSRVIVEKRATYACVPHLPRPPTATPLPGLVLAGDYVAGDYPATLEGTVRSGVAAARALLQPV